MQRRTVDNKGSEERQFAAVVLLAAGSSRRMGQPKQTLDWLGMPMVQYQVAQLVKVEAVGEVVVVLGYEADRIAPLIRAVGNERVSIALNLEYEKGKSTSVKAGLSSLMSGYGAIMVLAADQPRTSQVFELLLHAHFARGAPVSIPAHKGDTGHPPVFDSALLPELLAITEEREGVREVIRRHRGALHKVVMEDPLVVTNLNTMEDYWKALAIARPGTR